MRRLSMWTGAFPHGPEPSELAGLIQGGGVFFVCLGSSWRLKIVQQRAASEQLENRERWADLTGY
jgi:hypothetical protein